jgi:predicted HTH transcriptional regulator
MDFQSFIEILEQGEGFRIEFKRKVSAPEKIAKEMIAFANTDGGKIFFGVDDDRTVVGVESEKGEIGLIEDVGRNNCFPPIEPDIEIFNYKNKDVIIAYIKESNYKPHFLYEGEDKLNRNSKVYVRVNDKSIPASYEVIQVLKNERPDAPPVKLSIGYNEKRLFEYLEKNEKITVKEYSGLINVSERRASKLLIRLVKIGFIRIHTLEKSDYFTLAREIS